MQAHRHVVEKRAKIMTCDSTSSDQSEQTCIAFKKLTANELLVPSVKLCSGSSFLCFWFEAWNRQLVCSEFLSCNAGLLWLVAAERIASHYFRALVDYGTMRTHNLCKMLTHRKMNNVKMKTDQNKLHFGIKMAVFVGKCGWCFDVVLVVLSVLELLIEVSL